MPEEGLERLFSRNVGGFVAIPCTGFRAWNSYTCSRDCRTPHLETGRDRWCRSLPPRKERAGPGRGDDGICVHRRTLTEGPREKRKRGDQEKYESEFHARMTGL